MVLLLEIWRRQILIFIIIIIALLCYEQSRRLDTALYMNLPYLLHLTFMYKLNA